VKKKAQIIRNVGGGGGKLPGPMPIKEITREMRSAEIGFIAGGDIIQETLSARSGHPRGVRLHRMEI